MKAELDSGLVRSMRRWDLVAVVLNGVIGAGIFGLPSRTFALAGDYSLVSFVVCAVCVFLIVLSFAEVASRFSGTGGPYLFARDTFGPLTGFLVGWLVWVARVTAFAANCSLLPAYLGFFFPAVNAGLPRAVLLTFVVVTLTLMNVRGVRSATDAGNVLVIGKLLPLAIFILAGFFFMHASRFTFAHAPGYHAFSQSVLLLVYAFTGFEMAVIPAGEVRNPRRDIPAALIIGTAGVVLVYVSIQAVSIGTLPGLAASTRPLADAAANFLGPGGAAMITIGIVISLAGNLNVLLLSGSRLIFAMAERDELPTRLAAIHARFRTPLPAILLTAAVMLLLTLSGTFIYLLTISTLSRLATYIVTCGSVPVLRRRAGAPAAAFQLPGGIAIAFLAILLCLWLLSNSNLREARDTFLAVLTGLAVYAANRLHRRRLIEKPA
jgi:APA family basic amino acid/polyamine antiporter